MTNRRKFTPGSDAAGRGLPDDVRGLTSWRQMVMYPPELITIRLDIGWYRPESVGMFAAEAWISDTHELLAIEVHPVTRYDDLHHFLSAAQTWQRSVMIDCMDPDPFADVAGQELEDN